MGMLKNKFDLELLHFGAMNATFAATRCLPLPLGTTQSFCEMTGAEDDQDLLQGLELLNSWGVDLLSGLIATTIVTLGFLTRHYYQNRNNITLDRAGYVAQQSAILKNYIAIGLIKSFSFATVKAALAIGMVHGISVTNPFFHLLVAPLFAFSFALMSTFLEFYAEYQIKKHRYQQTYGTNAITQRLETFTEYLMESQASKFKQRFISNFLAGLGMYGANLIPGLNVWSQMATSTAISTTAAVLPYMVAVSVDQKLKTKPIVEDTQKLSFT